jgi:hypothetical protein
MDVFVSVITGSGAVTYLLALTAPQLKDLRKQ